MEWLRKHGSAKALSKVVGREALEGLVGIHIINNNSATGVSVASIVRVASETDFASRSEVLSSFVQEVANAAADASATAAATNTTTNTIVEDIPSFLKQTKTSSSTSSEDNSKTLDQCLSDTILAIRENLQVDCITTVQASSQKSIFGGYVHGRASPMSTCGSAASIVELVPITTSASTTTSSSAEAARKLAMHIVAAKPTYLNIDTVPHDVIAKEKEILHGKMISDGKTVGKPPDIIDKIIQGQLRKYYESVCLTEQIHMIEEGGVKVSKVLSDLGLEVKSFQLVGLGK
jgi:elongation factor Ts